MISLALLAVLAAPKNEIVPGVRIGIARIGASTLSIESLGEPKAFRARPNHGLWQSYSGATGHRLDVFGESLAVGDAVDDRIAVVRVTSPSFLTSPRALGPGASERTMRRSYPRARSVGTYRAPGGTAPIHVFDDVRGGIAFEVLKGRCVAVAVHRRGVPVESKATGYRAHLAAAFK